jgi:hypothetical protein
MKPGDLRSWCLTETVPRGRSPFLIVEVTEDGTVTILDCGAQHSFRHHDIEMYSVSCPAPDESR